VGDLYRDGPALPYEPGAGGHGLDGEAGLRAGPQEEVVPDAGGYEKEDDREGRGQGRRRVEARRA